MALVESSPSPLARERQRRERPSRAQSKLGTLDDISHSTTTCMSYKELINPLYGPVTFCINSIEEKAAVFSCNEEYILSMYYAGYCFHHSKYTKFFTGYKNGSTLCVSPLMAEDGGTCSLYTNKKTSNFTLQKFGTCKVKNCSHESCRCCTCPSVPGDTIDEFCSELISCPLDQLRGEGPVLQGKESSGKELEPVKGTAKSPIGNGSITNTTPGVLLNGTIPNPPSPGADSNGWIVAVVAAMVPLLVFFFFWCKSRALRGRCRGRAGRQRCSRGDGEADNETQAKENV